MYGAKNRLRYPMTDIEMVIATPDPVSGTRKFNMQPFAHYKKIEY